MLVVGQRIVDVRKDLSNIRGTVVMAKVEKLAPGLGIAFVSWTCSHAPNRIQQGILPLLNWRGRGPQDCSYHEARTQYYKSIRKIPLRATAALKHGDSILVQIVQEARDQKVNIVTGHISLVTSRLVSWPGSCMKSLIFPQIINTGEQFSNSLFHLELRGFLGYMLHKDTTCAGPKRWCKEQYTLEHQWEHLVLDLIEQKNQICTLPASSENISIQASKLWFQRFRIPWILVFNMQVRENVTRWMITNFPYIPRNIDITTLNPWKNWLHLHHAAIYQPRIPLRSGGTLILELTQVGWSLDINSGMALDIGAKSIANQEAIYAIVQQIILRCMHGIILIDLIPDNYIENIQTNLAELSHLIDRDIYHTRIISMSDDGLIRLGRRRSVHNSKL